ncbi:hypothetical protein RhiirA5_419797 [Rhizophagus irregularis]|uniref:Uncharacterized protein n=1 Tax=Rhizophagus irregularis TaxID=588596 RepID=A0A2N0PHI4_9GLOM|nr:hypothetical protein RhiirA5_419797 [Rhizophagus irregularis]
MHSPKDEDALTSSELNAVSIVLRSKEEHKNYNNLNNEFSKRMKEISNNEKATSSRTCDKDNVDSEDDNLNENKKRIMKRLNKFEDKVYLFMLGIGLKITRTIEEILDDYRILFWQEQINKIHII